MNFFPDKICPFEDATGNARELLIGRENIELSFSYVHTGFHQVGLTKDDTVQVDLACECCPGDTEQFSTVSNTHGDVILAKNICLSCGHMSYKLAPDEQWFDTYYSQEWLQNTIKKTATTPDLEDVLIPQLHDKKAKILEFGSGYGAAQQNLIKAGYTRVYGIEPAGESASHSASLGLNVIQGQAHDCDIHPEAPFDVIFSRQVLEHVIDLEKTMSSVSKALKPGGMIYLAVPNVEYEDIVSTAHYIPHYRHFSSLSLTWLLARHNFRVEILNQGERLLTVVATLVDSDKTELQNQLKSIDVSVSNGLASKVLRELFGGNLPDANEGGFRRTRDKSGKIQFLTSRNLSFSGKVDQFICDSFLGVGRNPVSLRRAAAGSKRFTLSNLIYAMLQRIRKFHIYEAQGQYKFSENTESSVLRLDIRHDTEQVYAWAM